MKAAAALATVGLLGVTTALAATASCGGGDASCGDGVVQEGEQCDDGNLDDTDFCRACVVYLPPRTIVKWTFNAAAAEGFTQDACVDVGAATVRVALTPAGGGAPVSEDGKCSDYQVVFDDLAPGTYQAAVTPLDQAGDPLVTAPVAAEVTAEAVDTETAIDVPPDAWTGPLTGTFYFKVTFGGMDCAPASVAQHRITLRVDGTVVSQQTMEGQRLDGSQPGPCVPASGSPQKALNVPFGLATIAIDGIDTGGTATFVGTFDTFVGAGASNPTLTFDVPTIYDAMPADAAPPDAGVPDAM